MQGFYGHKNPGEVMKFEKVFQAWICFHEESPKFWKMLNDSSSNLRSENNEDAFIALEFALVSS